MTNPIANIETNHGNIELELYADTMPQTVTNFATLAKEGYYNGTKFHRIIKNFMVQAGDPLTKDDTMASRWGTGGPGYTIEDEFTLADGTTSNKLPTRQALKYQFDGPGILAMANTGRPRSGGSQFFITLAPTPHLNGLHPIFGKVVKGDDVVSTLGAVKTDRSDRPNDPCVIEKITIHGDLPDVKFKKH